ncbi:hypothetical protein BJ170DRAFT_236705 [Xylariales sp. AK1849]|nr:hypothetical protein BJ170DRAFT_236705 [Xylariales sp. AK1849]
MTGGPTSKDAAPEVNGKTSARRLSPEPASSLKKHARFGDLRFAAIKEEEDDDEISSQPKPPKRPRITAPASQLLGKKSPTPKLPLTPSTSRSQTGKPKSASRPRTTLFKSSAAKLSNKNDALHDSVEDATDDDGANSLDPQVKTLLGYVKDGAASGFNMVDDEEGQDFDDDISHPALKPSNVSQPTSKKGKPPAFEGSEPSDSDGSGSEDANDDGIRKTALRQEQKLLSVIIKHKGDFTFMPAHWKMHLKGDPYPAGIFYNKTKSASFRPRIYARTERLEYNGSKKFRDIVQIPSRIRDIRYNALVVAHDESMTEEERAAERTICGRALVHRLRPVLEAAIEWSLQDGDLVKYGNALPPNIRIIDVTDVESDHAADAQIRDEMKALALEWHDAIMALEAEAETEEDIKALPRVPVIYGLAIVEHNVLIVHKDAEDPESAHQIDDRLTMDKEDRQKWNALAIMVTICWARDKLMEIAEKLKLEAIVEEPESDPDA